MDKKPKKPIYKRWWFIVLAIIVVVGVFGGGDKEPNVVDNDSKLEEVMSDTASQQDDMENKENKDNKEKEEPEPQEVIAEESTSVQKTEKPSIKKEPSETLSQKNAVKMAKSYLKYTAFSKSGLVKQLEFEGFDNGDATYAVNQLDTDWNEQAVKMAKNYLDYTSFSRSGLIDQLKFEGFSTEEATYAVEEVGF